jgi:integrase
MAHKRGKRWVAGVYDPVRKQKLHLGTFRTKGEARDAETDWRRKRKGRGTTTETCDSFAKRWPTDYPRPRASSNHYNADRVKRFADDFKGIRLGDVDRPTARAWAAKNPWNLGGVRAMFTDAVNDGLCDLNPFANLRLPQSKGRKDIVVLTEPELHALGDTALRVRRLGDFGREFRAMILFAGYVGVRPGELFALQRSDVNGQFVHIERALSSHTQTIDLPKNGQARTVTIPPAAQDALEDVTPNPNGLLFATPRGKMWTQSGHHRYWDLVRTVAGRPEFEFYALRHTAATILLERGATPWDVAVQLGHTDGGQLVMELYGHPSEEAARARLLKAFDDTVEPLRAIRKNEAV